MKKLRRATRVQCPICHAWAQINGQGQIREAHAATPAHQAALAKGAPHPMKQER